MARKNGRRIGANAEREAAERINRLFGTKFYRSQQRRGATDSADLVDDDRPDLCPEIKRRSDFSVKLHRAVEKARGEAGAGQSSFVVHRCPGERWLLTVDLSDAPELVARLVFGMAEGVGQTQCELIRKALAELIAEARVRALEAEASGLDGKRLKRRTAKGATSGEA